MACLGALGERVLADQQRGARCGGDLEAGFLMELAGEGGGGGLAELDVPAGEVAVIVFFVAAEQDPGVPEHEGAGDQLDVGGVAGHGGERHDTLKSRKGASGMTTKRTKPRLGRGLSSLLGEPVRIDAPPNDVSPPPPPPEDRPEDHPENAPRDAADQVTAETPAPPSGKKQISKIDVKSQFGGGGGPDDGGVATGLVMVALDAVVPNRFQPRSSMQARELDALAASIRVSGVMQPVAVRPLSEEDERGRGGAKYELVAGERRWRAARAAGLSRIPAVVSNLDDQACAEWALVENIQREDLNPIDRGMALRGLAERFGLSHARVGERVGMDRSSVTNFIRLTELEGSIRELIRKGHLSMGHGKVLLGMEGGVERERVAATAAQEQWTVRRLEQEGMGENGAKNGPGGGGNAGKNKNGQDSGGGSDAVLSDLSRQIGDHLGTKVRVESNRERSKGRIVIEFYGVDHFEGVLRAIGVPLDS